MTTPPRIVPLRPVADAATVDALRQMLAQAEAGEIVSIAAICECPDGSRAHIITPCRDAFALLADIARLQHRHQIAMDRQVTGDET